MKGIIDLTAVATASDTQAPFPASSPTPEEVYVQLDDCERRVVEIFVSAADVLGFARSLGEIYGLAYISARPIHLNEVCHRLQMSRGAASQGLRTLRDLGALKSVYVAGDRRDFFEPEIRIRVLLYRVLSERLRPHLDRSAGALEEISQLGHQPQNIAPEVLEFRQERIALLGAWRKRVSLFLPLVQRLLR